MARRGATPVTLSAVISGLVLCAATLIAQTAPTSLTAPEGFDVRKPGIQAGRVERIEYDSKVTGNKRPAMVYLPPGYSAARKYPVLYLLHGIGGDETEWLRFASPNVVLDNLIADGKAAPMIAVLANGRAAADDRAGQDPFAPEKVAAFARFERDLLDHLIPA